MPGPEGEAREVRETGDGTSFPHTLGPAILVGMIVECGGSATRESEVQAIGHVNHVLMNELCNIAHGHGHGPKVLAASGFSLLASPSGGFWP